MDLQERQALHRWTPKLYKELRVGPVVTELHRAETISEQHISEIMEKRNQHGSCHILLGVIKELVPSSFSLFVEILKKTDHDELGKSLELTLDEIYNSAHPTFTSYNYGGTVMSGLVSGGTYVQGNQHTAHEASRPPPTSSSGSAQLCAEEWQKKLEILQKSLKDMYLQRFRKTNPFSLPFTFDIENTWVSLELKQYTKTDDNTGIEEKTDEDRDDIDKENETKNKHFWGTKDYAAFLKSAFTKDKMLIIEGKPARGKTSLMRRIAYEWAKENHELSDFDLIIYAEFRKVREYALESIDSKHAFESIADLMIDFYKNYKNFIENEELEFLKFHLSNKRYCRQTLLLLDGYDESSLDKQCKELSTYLSSSALENPLLFNVVVTTRPGYLSKFRGRKGRFTFAEVLGFTTDKQKKEYISNHFSLINNSVLRTTTVHCLLNKNRNLNKLAEIPLFLTIICLVYERITDGTVLELYCSIIWWLIDRHQQDFPDRDIPYSFGFQSDFNDKFETIQEHYLHFSQLHYIGKMALHNLEKNEFKSSDFEQYNLQPIIEQVGLLRKEKKYDNSFKVVTSFFLPHKTIQEFLAACYCFCSNDPISDWLISNSKLDTSKMKEYEKFLLLIALSNKMPIHAEKRKYYFERITDINLDTTFDAFLTTAGYNNELLHWFLSQCINVRHILLRGKVSNVCCQLNLLHDASINDESAITSKMPSPTLLSFSDLIKLDSLTFDKCTFESNSRLSITNCPSLKNLEFSECGIESSTNLCIAALPVIETLIFWRCNIDLGAWQKITDELWNSFVKCMKLTLGKHSASKKQFCKDFNRELFIHLQKCKNIEKMEITIQSYKISRNDLLSFSDLMKLHSLAFDDCTFEASSQLLFKNWPSLKNLEFRDCEMKSSITEKKKRKAVFYGFTTMPAIDTVEFYNCTIHLTTWQIITDAIRDCSVKCLKLIFGEDFNKEFLIHLQKCHNVEKMEITIRYCKIRHDDLLSFSDLRKLHLMTFDGCTFEANSHISFTHCASLINLQFNGCETESITNLGIATLPANAIVEVKDCKIDLATWQSFADAIKNNSIKCLRLSADYFVKGNYPEFPHYLQKFVCIEEIHVTDIYGILSRYEEEVTVNLAQTAQKLPGLTSISILDGIRLKERNKERIEKAGQERNPDFLIKYVE